MKFKNLFLMISLVAFTSKLSPSQINTVKNIPPIKVFPLYKAVENGDIAAVQELLKDPDLNVNQCYCLTGLQPLHQAASDGNIAIVKLLLAHPSININAQSQKGETALYCAIIDGEENTTKLLLENNADLLITTYDGESVYDLLEGPHPEDIGLRNIHIDAELNRRLKSLLDHYALKKFLKARATFYFST